MEDTYLTVSGNVITAPRRFSLKDGTTTALFRLAATPRYLDRRTQTWREGETAYYSVWCQRALAENALACLHPGHPVVVHGRLRIRGYEKDGVRHLSADIEATTLGHDLRRGTTVFTRHHSAAPPAASEPSSASAGSGPPDALPAAPDGSIHREPPEDPEETTSLPLAA
ncbi:hypothetical protein GCM10009677_47880 [Sphaerisporangium rubeum]|uniref:Single-strand DNA-binding protein n=1 Tax=Sphaerisporangium rubeum TaxID=321317 RepID=A0A7X0IHY8_9ACTN|nr:single-stranded DNA-binding protein [Sphaerisporangium rubeum]MBB6475283.1 single-strand DNA-binding protein [Sphaerisporangium rubeum]